MSATIERENHAEEIARQRAELEIALAKFGAAVLDFADEMAAADGSEFSPPVAAGRLRNLVRGRW
ncbi:hypothetical protein [Nocardia sp. IFM 10818]